MREPKGVVAAIVPWNVPMMTTIMKLAPALLMGCCVILKPAPGDAAQRLSTGGDATRSRRAAGGGLHSAGRS